MILMTIARIIYIGTYSFVIYNFKETQKNYYIFAMIFIIIGLLETTIVLAL